MAASDKRGAPRRRGRADVGADAATVDRVRGSLWTEPVPSNLDRSLTTGRRRVSAGLRVAGEERHAGGAMAGVNWNRRYGFPGHQIANGGYGHGQELTVSPLEVISAFGTGPEAWSTVAGLWREKEHVGEAKSEEFVTKL